MRKMTPAGIRRIRKTLGLSQEEFARTMLVTFGTINRWEVGRTAPLGIHLRMLHLLEESLASGSFKANLHNPRAYDPMFFVYQLLEPLYGQVTSKKQRR